MSNIVQEDTSGKYDDPWFVFQVNEDGSHTELGNFNTKEEADAFAGTPSDTWTGSAANPIQEGDEV